MELAGSAPWSAKKARLDTSLCSWGRNSGVRGPVGVEEETMGWGVLMLQKN